MTSYKKAEIESEAAIYAEGTTFTRDDLMRAWNTLRQEGERLQDFFERYLRENAESMADQQTETFFVVRCKFDDPAGSADADYLFGSEPRVFLSENAAHFRAGELQAGALLSDWGNAKAPVYFVEEATRDELTPAELQDLEQ